MGITVDINIRHIGSSKRVRVFDERVEYSVDGDSIQRLDGEIVMNILRDILSANYDDLVEEYKALRTSMAERTKNSSRKDLRVYLDGELKAGIDCYVVKNTTIANRVVDEILYVLGILDSGEKQEKLSNKITRSEMLKDLDIDVSALEGVSQEFQCVELREKLSGLMNNLFVHCCLPIAKDEGELSPRQIDVLDGAKRDLQENRLVEAYVQVWEFLADNDSKSRQNVFYNAELKAIRPVLSRFMAKVNIVLLKK